MGYKKLDRRPTAQAGARGFATVETTATNLKPYGVSVLRAGSTDRVFTLDAPTVAYQVKEIVCSQATSANLCTVNMATTGVYVYSTSSTISNLRSLVFNGANEGLILRAVPTTGDALQWFAQVNVNSVSITTT